MAELSLEFHGVQVRLRSEYPAILAELRRDFAWFAADNGREPAVTLELVASAPPPGLIPGRARWRWRAARIGRRGSLRVVDYDGRGLLEYDHSIESGRLFSAEPALLHELAYLAVLSRVGDLHDGLGLHRVHALGFTFHGRGGLLLLPSGGGKSRLAMELLDRPGFSLLSDDIPLLSDGGAVLRANPLRIGLRGRDGDGVPEHFKRLFERRRFGPKTLVDVEHFRGAVTERAPLDWVLVGSRDGDSAPHLAPCSRARAAAALGASLVLGVGTPQVLELMAPPPPYLGGSLRLFGVAAARAASAARALARVNCGRFRLGRSPADNVAALETFLRAHPCASRS